MKLIFLLTAFHFGLTVATIAGTTPSVTISQPAIAFTENKGQVHDQNQYPRPDVLYGVTAGNLAVHIKKDGVSYQLYRIDQTKEVTDLVTGRKSTEIKQQTCYRVDLQWLNCERNVSTTQDKTLPGYNNYYFESCPDGALNVKSYDGVTLKNLYKGVDLHYYQKDGELKHDYVVAPHADYTKIQIHVTGAIIRLAPDGSLVLETPLGVVQEGAPLVFQKGHRLEAAWKIEDNTLRFVIPSYNPDCELVIDPITRLWGTYYGGQSVLNGSDYGSSCATDAFGYAYLSGNTISGGTIIATSGTHQSSLGGSDDAFLAKFDGNGVRIWGTYYGGSGTETGVSCAADPAGNVYLTGLTSTNGTGSALIATPGTYQTTHTSGGIYDAYLVKFNSSGIRIWGSYFGGSSNEFPSAVAVASDGIYVAGTTDYSSSGIFTNGIHQPIYGGGPLEAFLVKFNPAIGTQFWGTYYGGAADDRAFSCVTDAFDNVYMCGYTGTTAGNIIATPFSHQPTTTGTGSAYLVKFNPGGVRIWGTYYGNNGEWGMDCATDAVGNIYMSGNTYTTTTPPGSVIATPGTHQILPGGLQDAFVVKMDGSGARQWGTYYGGTSNEYGYSCAVDLGGNVYLGGTTSSTNSTSIATPGSLQTAYAGGTIDVFVGKLDPTGVRLDGTYYGGAGYDYGGFLALSTTGQLYAAGYTGSSTGTAIATPGSQQPVFGGTPYDAFLAKFDACEGAPPPPAINGATTACIGLSYTLSTPVVAGSHSYTWTIPAGWTGSGGGGYTIATTASVAGTFSLTTENICGVTTQTLNIPVYPNPTVTVNSSTLCSGKPFTLVPTGAVTYSYSSSQVVFPLVTSLFTVTGTSADGCSAVAISTITVFPTPFVSAANGAICIGNSFTIVPGGASTYTFSGGPVVTPSNTSSYSLTGTGVAGCTNIAVVTVSVYPLPNFTALSSSPLLCAGESATLSANGIVSFTTEPSTTDGVISPTLTTTYTVFGTDANGCNNTAAFTQVVDLCTGIGEVFINHRGIVIYPNPVKDVLHVDTENEVEVFIYNASGQIIKTMQLHAGQHTIAADGFAAGIYLVRVDDGARGAGYKIVKIQ